MIMTVWLYISIIGVLFFMLYIGHLIVNKINEVRMRRVQNRYRNHLETAGIQTSLTSIKTTKKELDKTLVEDKRTSKSVSLLFDNKDPVYADLHGIVPGGDVNRDKIICIKSDPSINHEKEFTTSAQGLPVISNSKGQSNSIENHPNSELQQINNISSSKEDTFDKNNHIEIIEISPPVKDNKNDFSKTELSSNKDITALLAIDKTANENLQEPVQNSIITNVNPTASAELLKNRKTATINDSTKDKESPSIKDENTDNSNNNNLVTPQWSIHTLTAENVDTIIKKTVTINDPAGDMKKSTPRKKKQFKFIELITPKGSFAAKRSKTTVENSHVNSKKKVIINDFAQEKILPSLKNEEEHSSIESIIRTGSFNTKPKGDKNMDDENFDKSNDEFVEQNDPLNRMISSIKDSRYYNEFLKAKDSIAKILGFDKQGKVNSTEDDSKTITSTTNTDTTKESTSSSSSSNTGKIWREPSSLFFANLTPYIPSTPKEMFAAYENALKSRKTDSCGRVAGDIKTSTSKLMRHPEFQTSYVQIKEGRAISKADTENSVSNCDQTEQTTNDNLPKSNCKVTFDGNDTIIKGSVSNLDHVCVINPDTEAQDDCKRIWSYESEIDSESSKLEEPATTNLDTTIKDNATPFKNDFIDEIVTVTNIFDLSHRDKLGNIKDTFSADLDESQTSYDLQSAKRTENDFYRQVDNLNTKLNELSAAASNQELPSRSLATVFKNVDSTFSEVIIVNNKYSANVEVAAQKTEKSATDPNFDVKKDILKMKDNTDSVQGSAKVEQKKNEDVDDDGDKSAGT